MIELVITICLMGEPCKVDSIPLPTWEQCTELRNLVIPVADSNYPYPVYETNIICEYSPPIEE